MKITKLVLAFAMMLFFGQISFAQNTKAVNKKMAKQEMRATKKNPNKGIRSFRKNKNKCTKGEIAQRRKNVTKAEMAKRPKKFVERKKEVRRQSNRM